MSKRIDFYFDFTSPYGYFASTRINELAAKYGHQVDWHPYVGEEFKPSNSGTGLSQIPAKLKYQKRDIIRTAQFEQIPYQEPSVTTLDARHAARAVLWVESSLGEAKGIELAQAILRAYHVEGKNISDTQTIGALAQNIGLNSEEVLAGISHASTREQFRAEVDLATAKGVFGSPFFILDGEPFWGFDRMDQLEAALKRKELGKETSENA